VSNLTLKLQIEPACLR